MTHDTVDFNSTKKMEAEQGCIDLLAFCRVSVGFFIRLHRVMKVFIIHNGLHSVLLT